MAAQTRPGGISRVEVAGFALTLVSAAAFGSMAILARFGYRGHASVLSLLTLRFAISTAVFWAVLAVRRIPAWPQDFWQFWILGGIGYTLQAVFFLEAVRYLSPPLAALFLYLYPAIVVLLLWLSRRSALQRTTLAGLFLAFVGLLLVLGLSRSGLTLRGALYGTGAAVVYSFYILYGQRTLSRHEPIVATAHIALSATIALVLIGLGTGGLDFGRFLPLGWEAGALLGIVGGAIAIFTFFAGLQRIGAARAAIVSMFEPVVTTVLSASVLGIGLGPAQMTGGLLVIVGGSLTLLPGRAAPQPPGV